MKRKKLALLLAAAITVASVDTTAFVSAADFSSEIEEEEVIQDEESVLVDENMTGEDVEVTLEEPDETEETVTEEFTAEDAGEQSDNEDDASSKKEVNLTFIKISYSYPLKYVQGVDDLNLGYLEAVLEYSDENWDYRGIRWDISDETGENYFFIEGRGQKKYYLSAVKEKADGEIVKVTGGKFSEAGMYKLQIEDEAGNIVPIQVEDSEWNITTELNIEVITKDDIKDTLMLGENNNLYSPELAYSWYRFETSDTDAAYIFQSNVEGIEIYDDDFVQLTEATLQEPQSGQRKYVLEKQKTYFVKLKYGFNTSDGKRVETGSMTIIQADKPLLKKMSYWLANTETIWGEAQRPGSVIEGILTEIDTDGNVYAVTPFKVDLKDGCTFKGLLGEEITFRLQDADGKNVSSDGWIKTGKYIYWFEAGDIKTEKTIFTVKEPAYEELEVGTRDVKAKGFKRVSFTPQRTGYYNIKVEKAEAGGTVDYAYYMNESGQKVQPIRDEAGNQLLYKGQTYYILITGRKFSQAGRPLDEAITLSVSEVKLEDCRYTTTTIPATCSTEGKIIETCQIHEGEIITTIIPKLAHNYEWVTDKEATCGAAGSRHQECTVCREKGKTEAIKATGKHSMRDWRTIRNATAVVEGTQERSCKVCGGAKQFRSIAKLKPTVTLNVSGTLPLKTKQTFQAKAAGLAAGDKVVEWTTSNKKIATVDQRTGKVKATSKTGKATITVKLLSGTKANFTVKVQKSDVATTSLTVVNKATGKKAAKTVNLKAKQKLTLITTIAPATSKQKVTYSTSNKKVATVTSKGVITAKKKGTATITVKSGKKSVKIKVVVK